MKTVQVLRLDNRGKKNWENLILDGSIWKTSKTIDQVIAFLNYFDINYIDVRFA